jgi:hypothetical protein
MKDWLSETTRIQREVYDVDMGNLPPKDHADYIRYNMLAAQAELIEALEESRWKPWASTDEETVPDRTAFIRELVDASMFIANMAASVGCTDEEWEEIYRAKWEVNIERQRRKGGYVSRKGVDKCVLCGRSFDDVGRAGGSTFCTKCEDMAVTG